MDIATLVAPLTTPEGLLQVLILMFLEIALGVDNLVFIALTTERLPKEKRHIGRRLGLSAAMIMRCILLCTVVWIMSINVVLFTLPFGIEGETAFDVRALIFLLGGIYLIFKGISELLTKEEDEDGDGVPNHKKHIGLLQATITIMIMDIVFSLDSVITAAGLSGQILVMCIAVIGAVSIMIIFADPISEFISGNHEIRTAALVFIAMVGLELLCESFGVETLLGIAISTWLYAFMFAVLVIALFLMAKRKRKEKMLKEPSCEE